MSSADTKLPAVVAVAGPTASGKSDLALRLCREFGGEIVCCDSMQIYRYMDIGTAKPTAAERAEIPHHMCDFLDPGTAYSAADYSADAKKCIDDVIARGRLPVICGGTGLYLDSLLFERPWEEAPGRTGVRERLEREAAEKGNRALWERLREVDPETAGKTHENNIRRVIRALELCELTGVPKSELDRRSGNARYGFLCLVLHRNDRSEQNARIERRVDAMLASGLEAETRMLDGMGVFTEGQTASQAIGYKEMLGYLHGEATLADARERIIVATRQYAKRQDTWFLHKDYSDVIEISAESPDPYPEACGKVRSFLGR